MISKKNSGVWQEDNRPNTVNGLLLPRRIKQPFRKGIFAHYLFVGDFGVGKTSLGLAISNMYFHSDDVVYMEAATQGIDFIRDKIEPFAKSHSIRGAKRLVIVDEIHKLNHKAQQSLGGIIESSLSTVFIATANSLDTIEGAIQSRLTVIDFSLTNEEASELRPMAKKICHGLLDYYGYSIDNNALEDLVSRSFPRMRDMIKGCQQAAYSLETGVKNITLSDVSKISIGNEVLFRSITFSKIFDAWDVIHEHYALSPKDAIMAMGEEYIRYLTDIKLTDVLPLVAIEAHEYQYKSAFSMDNLITAKAMVSRLHSIVRKSRLYNERSTAYKKKFGVSV